MIEIGKRVPAFDCEMDDGSRLNLTKLRGQAAVLYFYPADDTETCTLEAQQFSARVADFAALGVAVIGVSPDGVPSHCKFRQKYGLTVPLACDPDHVMCEAFGVWQRKTMFGRSYMGVERSTVLLDKAQRAVQIWRKVRLKGHVESVLAAAEKLAKG